MSVGGTVTETVVAGDKVWIDTREREQCLSTTAIYVENTPAARVVSEGDSVWWQGSYAFWTPKRDGKRLGPIEVKLKRVGCSGVSKPAPRVCSLFEASDYENTMCQRCGFLQSQHPSL